ncbi:MAG: enoyl-CoA hydratase/isomerase family protein [Deltaproteobacteria bacterium]|nr:enoyl-CoA hydratase/isomerase family protein [Deltaproteobacteria bacterium]
MVYQVLRVERKGGGYAIITFNRPDKLNAANAQVFGELAEAVRELDADKNVGCIILTGQTFTHPKKGTPFPVFSAGADVEEFAGIGKTEAGFDFIKICFEPFKAIEFSETPVIAAVNGAAFGFGFEIMGACDMAFASLSAKFALKEINHGAVPAWTVTRGLEKLGKNVVAYLCMSAVEIGPEEAKRLGVVIDVFEDEELMPKCEALAKRIAANSYIAKTFIKTTLNRRAMEDYQEAERYMPTIFASKFMQGAFARFLKGDSKNVK